MKLFKKRKNKNKNNWPPKHATSEHNPTGKYDSVSIDKSHDKNFKANQISDNSYKGGTHV